MIVYCVMYYARLDFFRSRMYVDAISKLPPRVKLSCSYRYKNVKYSTYAHQIVVQCSFTVSPHAKPRHNKNTWCWYIVLVQIRKKDSLCVAD